MAKHAFKYYLHDDCEYGEVAEYLLEEALPSLADTMTRRELTKNLRRKGTPFYEVELDCELDDETFEITIKGVK